MQAALGSRSWGGEDVPGGFVLMLAGECPLCGAGAP